MKNRFLVVLAALSLIAAAASTVLVGYDFRRTAQGEERSSRQFVVKQLTAIEAFARLESFEDSK